MFGSVLHVFFAPGFFESAPVTLAVVVGGIVSIVSAVVGVFTVIRGQSFAGHALSDVGTTGGSAAFLVGVNPLWGFIAAGLSASGIMELIGIRRQRGRDLGTGIVLGAALGLAALFLYLDTTIQSATGATQTILFGSLFVLDGSLVPALLVLGVFSVGIVGLLFRPLLLSSISPDLARARGIPVRLVGVVYLLALATVVSLASLAIGTILATALLIGPPAAAIRLTRRPGRTVLTASLIGLLSTVIGIVLAYDSITWPPAGHGWPVSFFVVALVFLTYLLAGVPRGIRHRSNVGES